MSDSPSQPGGTPSPNQSDIDAALAAASAPAAGDPRAAQAQTPVNANETPLTGESAAAAATTPVSPAADVDAALAAGLEGAVATAVAPAAPAPEPVTAEHQFDANGQPYNETAAAMAAALAEEQAADASRHAAAMAEPPPGSMPLELPDFGRRAPLGEDVRGVDLLNDVDLNVKIELGRAEMSIDEVLRLGAGAVVELNKLAGDPVDVLVNDRLVARGEVLILNDNFCVRISEILAGEEAEATP